MVRFQRTIGISEVRTTYLNLTDDHGRTYGSFLPGHRTQLRVIDGDGRHTNAQKHHDNQIWGAIKNWFLDNNIQPGTRIEVRFDTNERGEDGLQVVHLIPLGLSSLPTPAPVPTATGQVPAPVEQPAAEIPLSLERQLEDFLVGNLHLVEPGLRLYRDEDGREGQQYPTDVGVIDILCQRPSGEIVVIELKRSKSSDVVVGQISRYMGWVERHLAYGRAVSGVILTYERDETLRYAVLAHSNLSLKRFKVLLEISTDDEP